MPLLPLQCPLVVLLPLSDTSPLSFHGSPQAARETEKMGSAPGGLCTTGLQDRDVSTIAAIISSISTASDFLESNGRGARYLLGPAGPPSPQIKLPYPLIFMGSPYTAMLSPQISHPSNQHELNGKKATNVESACSGWCLNEPRVSRCPHA